MLIKKILLINISGTIFNKERNYYIIQLFLSDVNITGEGPLLH